MISHLLCEISKILKQLIPLLRIPKHNALVVGAGYISLEVLENLHHRGLDVTWIHRSTNINKLMDQDMNQPIIDEIEKRNITYRFNEEISHVNGHEVTFTSGKVENFDLIIEGVGTHPNSQFIKSSNVILNDKVISQ